MRKKILGIALLGLTMLGLTSCGDEAGTTIEDSNRIIEVKAPQDYDATNIKYYVFQANSSIWFLSPDYDYWSFSGDDIIYKGYTYANSGDFRIYTYEVGTTVNILCFEGVIYKTN